MMIGYVEYMPLPNGHTILLVDDDPDDQELFVEMLQDCSDTFTSIVTAGNGQEALDKLKHLASEKNLPCLIVMDINMPRMDGRETLLAIKEENAFSKIPIVIFSTSHSETDRFFFTRHNVEYITKPLDVARLKNIALHLLGYCNIKPKE